MMATAIASLTVVGVGAALSQRCHAEDDEDISVDALLASAPGAAEELIERPADAESFEAFLDRGFDRDRDDVSGALARASAWSAQTRRPVFIEGTWLLRNPTSFTHSGATLIFANAEFRVRDDGRWITTRFPDTLPFAFYVTGHNVSLLGHCILTGLGRPGNTFLQGAYFDQVQAPTLGRFTLRNMAVGLHFMCCDDVRCGFVDAFSMWGLQGSPERPNGAGSAQVVSGCRRSHFGGMRAVRTDKSARYLAVGLTADRRARDNSDNEFGPAEVVGRAGSAWSHVTGVRSSRNSRFAGGTGRNVSFLVILQKYATDEAYSIDGNVFGDWSGTIIDHPASSVDAAINVQVSDDAQRPVGKNRFGRIAASMSPMVPGLLQRLGFRFPANFGIYVNSGEIYIESADFDGFTTHIYVADATLEIGSLRSQNMAARPVGFGRGADLRIGSYEVASDVLDPWKEAALIAPHDSGKGSSARVSIDRIDVREAMPARNTDYIIASSPGSATIRVGRMHGRMRKGDLAPS